MSWKALTIALQTACSGTCGILGWRVPVQAVQDRTPGFRPSKMQMDAALQSIAVVLCNDKPQTFGAPDVLQLSTHQVLVHFAQDTEFPDRPPNQAWPCFAACVYVSRDPVACTRLLS